MRFCLLLLIGSLAGFGQESTNAVSRPRNFSHTQSPSPAFILGNPYSEFLKQPARPIAPSAKHQTIEPMPSDADNKCGHIVIYKPKQHGFIKTLPLPKEAPQMPEVKSLQACPSDIR